jgi:His/Glu/Gln/Arg/opine family amino acid ABC transporter permease subunit
MIFMTESWKERFNHLPWYRKYEFLVPSLFLLILVEFFLVPPMGKPEQVLTWLRIFVSYLLMFSWVILILTDKEKPVWLKRTSSLSAVAIFFYFFYLYSGADWGRMGEVFFKFETLEGVWPMYLYGIGLSLKLTALAAVFSVLIGTFLGVLRSFKNPVLSLFTIMYVDFFRAFPLIVLMMVVFYALPFIGIDFSPFMAAAVSIVLMYSAYIAEIIRSGIEAVHKSQVDAARSLGMSKIQALIYVELPQAIRIIIPPLTSSVVGILKDTVVAYTVTLPELLTQAQQAAAWKRNSTPVIVSAMIYIIILLPLTHFSKRLEMRSRKWVKK